MQLKNRSILEDEVNGRVFKLECPSEANWQEVVMVLSRMHSFAEERIKSLTPASEEPSKECEIQG